MESKLVNQKMENESELVSRLKQIISEDNIELFESTFDESYVHFLDRYIINVPNYQPNDFLNLLNKLGCNYY